MQRQGVARGHLADLVIALLAGIALATATVYHERVGPAPASWADEQCAPAPFHPCTEGVLQGGWPAGYLLDSPGISVMGQLAFIEDRFEAGAFAADAALLTLPVLLALALRRRVRARRRR